MAEIIYCKLTETSRVYHDRYLRQKCFQQHGIGNHTDICAKPYQCNTVNGLWFIKFFQNFSQGFAAKGWLVNGSGLQKLCDLLPDLPAVGAADAVLYRKHSALLGLQIIPTVSIPGRQHKTIEILHSVHHIRHNGFRLRCTKRSVNKIILHIDHN